MASLKADKDYLPEEKLAKLSKTILDVKEGLKSLQQVQSLFMPTKGKDSKINTGCYICTEVRKVRARVCVWGGGCARELWKLQQPIAA